MRHPQVTTTPTIKKQFPFRKTQKIDLPRLQINEKLRVRQYIMSDPSNI